MSQIARVFVVLNLLLAAGFLFAASTFLGLNADWKAKHGSTEAMRLKEVADLNTRISANNAAIAALEGEKNHLNTERGTLKSESDGLKTQLAASATALAEKDTQIAGHLKNVASMTDVVKRAQDSVTKLTDENTKLRGDSADAQKKEREANDALTKARDDIRARDTSIAGLEKDKVSLSDKNHEQSLVIEAARKSGFNLADTMAAEPVKDARVLAVDMGSKFVQTNAGKNMKVGRGAKLDIVRGDRYIGQITVDQVYETSSAGTLWVLKPGESVMVGDRVTNTLN